MDFLATYVAVTSECLRVDGRVRGVEVGSVSCLSSSGLINKVVLNVGQSKVKRL